MRYRLIATDIDDTLIPRGGSPSPRTLAVLRQLEAAGVPVILSTARPPRTVRPIVSALGLTGPVICYNGALIYDVARERVMAHHPIPTDVALAVLAVIRQAAPAANVGLELADEWHVDTIDQATRDWVAQGQLKALPHTGDLERAVRETGRGVSKLYFSAPAVVRAGFEEGLVTAGLRESVTITSSSKDFVEVLAAGVSKGAALRAVAAMLGVPLERTVALGDEENDIPALQAAGLAIAMAGSAEPVRQAAHAVAGPCAADGWAEAVERLVLAG